MKKELYFRNNDEHCYTIEQHYNLMMFNGETKVELFKAKVDRNNGYFYCKEFSEVGESKVSCGKQCEKYIPRNGRSGICKHHGFLYEQTKESTFLLVSPE